MMTGFFAFLSLLFVSGVLAWATGVLAAAVCLALLTSGALRPAVRIRHCLMLAGLPWLLPFIVMLSVVTLAAAKPLGLIADHCLYHGPGHPHLCLGHLPAIAPGVVMPAALLTLLAAFVVVVLRHWIGERRTRSTLRTMASLARGSGRLKILSDPSRLAFAAAVPDPMILMTNGMLDKLDRRERRVVLAHEVAHLRHRDIAWNRVYEVLLLLQLPWVAAALRKQWRQALEERADDIVARRFGPDVVAQTLLTLVGSAQEPSPAALSANGGNALRRIDRLLRPERVSPVRQTAGKLFDGLFVIAMLGLPVLVVSAHHALESLIGYLLGA